jgi:hypothetical protein
VRSAAWKSTQNRIRPAAHSLRSHRARPPGKQPETEFGPRPARSGSLSPPQAAVQPETKKPARGPLALRASRAPGHNLGLGRESRNPPGLEVGPVSVSRSSGSDGCARFSAEQNPRPRPRAQTLAILALSLSLLAPQRRLRAPERRRRERAGGAARGPRRRARSPLGERAAVECLSGAPLRGRSPERRRAALPEASSSTRSRSRPPADERWPDLPADPQIHGICGRR